MTRELCFFCLKDGGMEGREEEKKGYGRKEELWYFSKYGVGFINVG